MAWRRERRVVNPRPGDGLSSSLRVGLDAAVEVPGADAVLVVLGDQPALRPAVIRAVLTAAASPATAARRVRPRPLRGRRRAQPGAGPPCRLGARRGPRRRPGARAPARRAPRARRRGPGCRRPTRTWTRPLTWPRWRSQPRRPDHDPRRHRSRPPTSRTPGPSASAPTASRPSGCARRRRATSTPPCPACSSPTRGAPASPCSTSSRRSARPDSTWLDIGAGAGRYTLPLALRVRQVIAVEPSAGMRRALRTGLDEHGIDNVRVVPGFWPESLDELATAAGGRRRADRPRRLRHRADRPVPRRDGGGGERAVRRGAHRPQPGRGRGPLLADRPRRGARAAAGAAGPRAPAAGARPRDRGHPGRAVDPRLRLRRGADRVPPPPAVHRRGRREGRPLPGGPARHDRPARRRVDARRGPGGVGGDRHLAGRHAGAEPPGSATVHERADGVRAPSNRCR